MLGTFRYSAADTWQSVLRKYRDLVLSPHKGFTVALLHDGFVPGIVQTASKQHFHLRFFMIYHFKKEYGIVALRYPLIFQFFYQSNEQIAVYTTQEIMEEKTTTQNSL